jgi:hypothetical protein
MRPKIVSELAGWRVMGQHGNGWWH